MKQSATIVRTPESGRATAAAQAFEMQHGATARAFEAPHKSVAVHSLSRLSIPRPQARLTVSQPGDRLEREADEAADRVVGSRSGSLPAPPREEPSSAPRPAVQRRDGAALPLAGAGAGRPASARSAAGSENASRPVTSSLAALRGGGVPLSSEMRGFFESRFGRDFSDVRVHDDDAAHAAARALDARAFTYGRDVVFGARQFSPSTDAGRHLIAHELAHVVQQGAAAPTSLMRKSSYGTPGMGRGTKEGPSPSVEIVEEESLDELEESTEGTPDVQREAFPGPDGEGSPRPSQMVPALAAPTLNLTPGATLVRGDTLTAAVAFTPTAGETLNVTGWKYTTTDHGDVTRSARDAGFQTGWNGTMALSGTLEMTYAITPAGGTADPDETLTQDVTVNDRTGAPWAASVIDGTEAALAGKPSPPRVFSDLGLHRGVTPGLTPTGTRIPSGPNTGLRYVSAITTGDFQSNPFIHPDLTAATSRFQTFHADPSRLYMIRGTTKRLIPITDYSGLTITPSLSFTVPDWEAFYKAHGFYRIRATFNGAGVNLQSGWWALASNAEDASIDITNDAAIRAALRMTNPDDTYATTVDGASWSGFELMQAAAILAGTRSHEYAHGTHSHRANFKAMIRALDPPKLLEKTISSATTTVNFSTRLSTLMSEILEPNHELVDEAQSAANEEFVAAAGEMAGVNTDPASGAFLGSVWNITGDDQMTN